MFEMWRSREPWWALLQSVRSGADTSSVLGLQHHARARNKLLLELRQGALGRLAADGTSLALPALCAQEFTRAQVGELASPG